MLKSSSARGLPWICVIALATLVRASETQPNTNSWLKYEEPRALSGTIYPLGSDRKQPLYQFNRQVTRQGDRLDVIREFTYPDGKLAVREKAVYQGDALISWTLEELQTGTRGTATLDRTGNSGRIRFEYYKNSDTNAAPKKRVEELQKNTLACDMVGPFLRDHWESLARGEEIRCRYIVVPRMETIGFTFAKYRDELRKGQPVLIIKMSPTSPIISALVDPLFFVMERTAKHRVLEYSGRTTPKIKVGSKWKDLDALSVFSW